MTMKTIEQLSSKNLPKIITEALNIARMIKNAFTEALAKLTMEIAANKQFITDLEEEERKLNENTIHN